MKNNVVQFPPPPRFNVEDSQDENGEWTVWTVADVTGQEALIYEVGNESPWAGDTIEQIIKNALDCIYGHDDSDDLTLAEVNLNIYRQALSIQARLN